ncbi:MAG TPA: TIM barrel protein [Candidatus Cybelea sp.]|jgi:hydroxypyruvate isomerase|nr:TIM barrel protein [Candidatus Cybelea sp.]
MNRRQFTQAIAASAFAAASPALPAVAAAPTDASAATAFPLSVMLWTVFNDLPFEERLAKVVEAGYTNIELVGEYAKWGPADFDRANAARKRLGIRFDATAGLKNGVANPAQRDALMAELGQALIPMQSLGCPAMIMLSGNVVPGLTHDAQHQSCIDSLKAGAKLVEGKQIDGQPVRLLLECIHLEENPHYYLTSATEAIEIVREVNHPQVQFLYDIYHEQMSFGQLIEKLDKHIDVIGLVHIADVPGRHEPGTGEVNYGNIYKKLAQLNYKHVAAMEFRPSGDPVATLRAAKAMVIESTRV